MNLFDEYQVGEITLKNRFVMAPMTRSRAINNVPNDMMAEYYRLRADAGLIITEGVAPSASGLGYPRIPGVYNQAQIDGWRKTSKAVHADGGRIFMQLMHTGRVAHPSNMEPNTRILAPSSIAMKGNMWTDEQGPQSCPVPEEMSREDIQATCQEYVTAALNAIEAGFDGVELHGANGYLIEQFLNPSTNTRDDDYGGSVENRCRFAVEVATAVSKAIGSIRTGIRLSPYGVFNDMAIYDDIDATYSHLASELGRLGLAYIHHVDFSPQGAPEVPASIKAEIQKQFGGTIIANGGFDRNSAEAALVDNKADMIAFGVPFLANPDLIYRYQRDLELNTPDFDTFYTPGEKGYLDYPVITKTVLTSSEPV
ncbi:MAG: alkene reductase [Candidatus Thiodiazotropha sp. (ex. Lucinisca nassula)]|nr:alkene reductase [Candidatus Thiodiazotropha sp. (ex. Lucinisca nassula)]